MSCGGTVANGKSAARPRPEAGDGRETAKPIGPPGPVSNRTVSSNSGTLVTSTEPEPLWESRGKLCINCRENAKIIQNPLTRNTDALRVYPVNCGLAIFD